MNEHWDDSSARADCNAALEQATRNLGSTIEESGARITHEPLPTVIAEEVPLVLLFQNLISNAIKYRREGETPQIRIGASPQHGMWHISLADNGIGIAPQHLDTIFAPFKRLHGIGTISRQRTGTGHLQEDCRARRGPHLGRVVRPWIDVPLYDSCKER